MKIKVLGNMAVLGNPNIGRKDVLTERTEYPYLKSSKYNERDGWKRWKLLLLHLIYMLKDLYKLLVHY